MYLPDSLITNTLRAYGFIPTAQQRDLIRTYVGLLLRWNRKISLTKVTDPAEILRFHFGESLYALTTGIVGDGRLADVGSGAGFPGIPLAIANRELRVTLLEPNLKKSVFLSEVVRELQLNNVEIARVRMEDFRGGPLEHVTARAVGHFSELFEFSSRVLSPVGKVVLWIGMDDSKKLVVAYPEWEWSEPRLIPKSERRYLVYVTRRIAS